MRTFHTRSTQETIELGKKFASELSGGDVVALHGNLGSGKTHFVIGVCEGLGVGVHATSPTFTMINEYDAAVGKVVHIDLYRVAKRQEVTELGIEEYFNDECVCLIEWPGLIDDILPKNCLHIHLEYGASDTERRIRINEAVHA